MPDELDRVWGVLNGLAGLGGPITVRRVAVAMKKPRSATRAALNALVAEGSAGSARYRWYGTRIYFPKEYRSALRPRDSTPDTPS